MQHLIMALLCSFVLFGCGSEDPDSHVFDAQEKALNKAKDLQKDIDAMAEEQRKRIEEATK